MSSIFSTSTYGVGTHTTSLPGWPGTGWKLSPRPVWAEAIKGNSKRHNANARFKMVSWSFGLHAGALDDRRPALGFPLHVCGRLRGREAHWLRGELGQPSLDVGKLERVLHARRRLLGDR